MPGRGSPFDILEPLVDADTVVVGVVVKVGLGTDVEKLVIVKEIEIEETAQKSWAREVTSKANTKYATNLQTFASWIVCFN